MAFSDVNIIDSSGNEHHGTVVGSPSVVASYWPAFGNKITTTGTSRIEVVGTDFDVSLYAGWCIDFRFGPVLASSEYLVGIWHTTASLQQWFTRYDATDNKIKFQIYDSSNNLITLASTTSVNDSAGHAVSVEFDGNALFLFLDGVLEDTHYFTQTDNYFITGAEEPWVVPTGVFEIEVDLAGADGGDDPATGDLGGKGARIQATMPVTPGETLYIGVGYLGEDGGGGPNSKGVGKFYLGGDGGDGSVTSGSAGGGASYIKRGGTALANTRVMAAGGGGCHGGTGSQQSVRWTTSSFYDETQTPDTAPAHALNANNAGGGGGGWTVGPATTSNSQSGRAGTNMVHSEVTNVTCTGNYRNGDGYVTITYTPKTQNVSNFTNPTSAEVTWEVPPGVTFLEIDMTGAEGGNGGATSQNGHRGGRLQATLAVTPGQTLYLGVGVEGVIGDGTGPGAGGWYEGGDGAGLQGGGGGGQSYISFAADAANRVMVAGGGGGGAANNTNTRSDGKSRKGGWALDDENTTPAVAGDASPDGGGGGGGWRGGVGGSGSPNAHGQGGTNMAHTAYTSDVTSTADASLAVNDGYINITYYVTAASFRADQGEPLIFCNRGANFNHPSGGGVDEIRFSKTPRRNGTNYTIEPVPFVADANTVGLWHMDALNNSTGFVEEILTPATTTWQVPSIATHGFDVTEVDIQCYGPGGNGGSNTITFSGGGGGGGGFGQKNDFAVTPGANINYRVGNNGANQTTWFNSTATVLGDYGRNGANATALAGGSGGAGGTSNVGDVTFNGAAGTNGALLGSGGVGGGGAGDAGNGTSGNGGPTDGGDPGQQPGGGGNAASAGGDGLIRLRYIRSFLKERDEDRKVADVAVRSFTRDRDDSRHFSHAEARSFTRSRVDSRKLAHQQSRSFVRDRDESRHISHQQVRRFTRDRDDSRRYADTHVRSFLRERDENRLMNDDDVRNITRARREKRKVAHTQVRSFVRDRDDSRQFSDVAVRRFTRDRADARKLADTAPVRSFVRNRDESRRLAHSHSRSFTRSRDESRRYEHAQGRSFVRNRDESRRLSHAHSRSFTRSREEDRKFEHQQVRSFVRDRDDSRRYNDTHIRFFTRNRADSRRYEVDRIRRSFVRARDENRLMNDDDVRSITRSSSEQRRFADTHVRSFTRSREEGRQFAHTHSRSFVRERAEGRRLAHTEVRSFARSRSDVRKFADAPVVRTFIRKREERRKLEATVRRSLTRSRGEVRKFAQEFRAELRRADYEGFGIDRALLLEHAPEWLNEHYGPYIVQIIERILSDVQESDGFTP